MVDFRSDAFDGFSVERIFIKNINSLFIKLKVLIESVKITSLLLWSDSQEPWIQGPTEANSVHAAFHDFFVIFVYCYSIATN